MWESSMGGGKMFWYQQRYCQSLVMEFSDWKLKQKGFFPQCRFRFRTGSATILYAWKTPQVSTKEIACTQFREDGKGAEIIKLLFSIICATVNSRRILWMKITPSAETWDLKRAGCHVTYLFVFIQMGVGCNNRTKTPWPGHYFINL